MTPDQLKGMDGRRVLVEGRLIESRPDKDGDLLVGFAWGGGETCERYVSVSAIREILPELIKVGDRVKPVRVQGPWPGSAMVLAVHEGRAWILYDNGRRDDWSLDALTLAEPGQ